MSHRTQSDTLKLQKLIAVLKDRHSDLGHSLENAASDLLADVKPRSAVKAAAAVEATTATAVVTRHELPHRAMSSPSSVPGDGPRRGSGSGSEAGTGTDAAAAAALAVAATATATAAATPIARSASKRSPPSAPPPPVPIDQTWVSKRQLTAPTGGIWG